MEQKQKKKNPHEEHRKRVKETVYNNGFSHMDDHQLLELLLFHSIPRSDTNELAHRLLDEFDSLDEIFNAEISRLEKIDGVGPVTAIMLTTVGETFRRVTKAKGRRKLVCKTSEDFKKIAVAELSNVKNEKVVIFCFDSAKRLKKTVTISDGTKNTASIDVRKVVQAVIDTDATFAVIAHNHPESSCEPSASDVDSTRSICVMFRKLGFVLADHIIVGFDDSTYSMRSDPMFTQLFY